MPTVPRVVRPSVGTAPLPGVRVGGVQQAGPLDLSPVIQLGAQIHAEERDKADRSRFMDVEAQASKLQTDIQVEMQGIGGRNALGVPELLEERWKKGTTDLTKDIKGDRLKGAVQNALSQRYQQLYGFAQQHMARETEKADADSLETLVANEMSAAILNAHDAQSVGLAMARQENGIRDFAARYARRLPEGWAEQKLQDVFSKTHIGVISRLLDAGRDQDASAYFDLVKGEISGAEIGKVEKALESGSTLAEAQHQTDVIMAAPDITRSAAYEKARAIANPKVRAAVSHELDTEFARRDRALAEQEDADTNQIAANIRLGQTLSPVAWSRLPEKTKRQMLEYREQLATGQPVQTDWTVYNALMQSAADPASRAEFLELKMSTFLSKLAPVEFKEIARIQASLRKGDDDTEVRGTLTNFDMVNKLVKATAGDVFEKNDDETQRRKAMFELAVSDEVAKYRAESGKKYIPREEAQKIVDRLLIEVVFEKGTFSKDKRVPVGAILQEDDRGRAFVPLSEIPPDDRTKLQDFMRRLGLRANPDDVGRAYANIIISGESLEDLDRLIAAGNRAAVNGVLRLGSRNVDWRAFQSDSVPPAPSSSTESGLQAVAGAMMTDVGPPVTMGLRLGLRAARSLGGGPETATPKPSANVPTNRLPSVAPPSMLVEPVARGIAQAGAEASATASETARPAKAAESAPGAPYTADRVMDAIAAYRDRSWSDPGHVPIPKETEDLEGREKFLRAFLENRYSLGGSKTAVDRLEIVRRAEEYLRRIERIKKGEIEPSPWRATL